MSVESYCATVPSGQYAKYDSASSVTICSVDANLATQNEDGRTTIIGKQKMNGSKSLDQEKRTKESMAEMKVQWDLSVVPRIYMIEKEENLRRLFNEWE